MESGYRMARLNFYLQTYQIICKEVTLLGIDLEAELTDLRGGWISRVSWITRFCRGVETKSECECSNEAKKNILPGGELETLGRKLHGGCMGGADFRGREAARHTCLLLQKRNRKSGSVTHDTLTDSTDFDMDLI